MTTRSTKHRTTERLEKIRQALNDIAKCDWCQRYQNLMTDVDNLQWDIDELSNYEPWPQEFAERFIDISETSRRISIIIK